MQGVNVRQNADNSVEVRRLGLLKDLQMVFQSRRGSAVLVEHTCKVVLSMCSNNADSMAEAGQGGWVPSRISRQCCRSAQNVHISPSMLAMQGGSDLVPRQRLQQGRGGASGPPQGRLEGPALMSPLIFRGCRECLRDGVDHMQQQRCDSRAGMGKLGLFKDLQKALQSHTSYAEMVNSVNSDEVQNLLSHQASYFAFIAAAGLFSLIIVALRMTQQDNLRSYVIVSPLSGSLERDVRVDAWLERNRSRQAAPGHHPSKRDAPIDSRLRHVLQGRDSSLEGAEGVMDSGYFRTIYRSGLRRSQEVKDSIMRDRQAV